MSRRILIALVSGAVFSTIAVAFIFRHGMRADAQSATVLSGACHKDASPSVELSWQPVADATTNGLQKWDCYPNDPENAWCFLDLGESEQPPFSVYAYTDTDVTHGSVYKYRVKTSPSTVSNVITCDFSEPPPPPPPPPPPTPEPAPVPGPVPEPEPEPAPVPVPEPEPVPVPEPQPEPEPEPVPVPAPKPVPPPPAPKPTLLVSPSSRTIMAGDRASFAVFYDPDGSGAARAQAVTDTAAWTSTHPDIAVYQGKGVFRGGVPGRATLTAFYNGLSARAALTVTRFKGAPFVKTLPAANVTQTSLTLQGAVNPNGVSTDAWFEYGVEKTLGMRTEGRNVGTGSSAVPFEKSLLNLNAGREIFYRAVARNASGIRYGSVVSTNVSHRPTFAVLPMSLEARAGDTARFSAYYDSDGVAGEPQKDVSGEAIWISSENRVASHEGEGSFRVAAGGTARITAYYNPVSPVHNLFDLDNLVAESRLTAIEEAGGAVSSSLHTLAPSDVTARSAVFRASVDFTAGAGTASAWFQYGVSDAFGSSTDAQEIGTAASSGELRAEVGGLSPRTAYYYRAVLGRGFVDRDYGETVRFTTGRNWTRIILALLAGLLAAGAIFAGALWYMRKRRNQ